MDLIPQNYNRIGDQMERICSRTCKPFGIILTYFFITQLSGVTIFLFWGFDILQKPYSSMDPHVVNVVCALTRIVSGLFCSTLIFKFGRRRLALISGLGVGLICIFIGILYYEKYHNLVPRICYVAYIIFSTIGHYTIPALIVFLIYPLQIHGILCGISLSNIFFLLFAVNICYPHVCELLGFGNTITSFGVCTVLGCIYLYFCLPESKGLTLQEVAEYFNDVSPRLTYQRKLIAMQKVFRSVSATHLTRTHLE